MRMLPASSLVTSDASRILARKSDSNLNEVFPEPGAQATPQRFVAVPMLAADDHTEHVFVLDASRGDMALVEGFDARRPVLSKLSANLYDALRIRVKGDDLG